MRSGTALILGLCLLGIVGCGKCKKSAVQRDEAVRPPLPEARALDDTTLLFDAWPGRTHASDVAFRSDWPSTQAYYTTGQVIWFRERFYDYHGPSTHRPSHTYRRFDTYRTGVGYR